MFERTHESALISFPSPGAAEALAQLAAGTAHELNNPLSVIVGYLSLILAGRTPPEHLQDQLQKIAAEARHCRTVLNGLTELAESALADVELVDLRAVLEDAEGTHGATLDVSIVGEARVEVRGQRRGLTNLVNHAFRNAVEASARSLRLTVTRVGDVTRLELRDDGCGMPAPVLSRARVPFFTTKPSSMGLGLAVCDAVAWAHGGSLALASSEGGGTTLTLSLPSGVSSREGLA